MNPEHTDLQNPNGIYGANLINFLSLLYIILLKIAVLQNITQIHEMQGKGILEHANRQIKTIALRFLKSLIW